MSRSIQEQDNELKTGRQCWMGRYKCEGAFTLPPPFFFFVSAFPSGWTHYSYLILSQLFYPYPRETNTMDEFATFPTFEDSDTFTWMALDDRLSHSFPQTDVPVNEDSEYYPATWCTIASVFFSPSVHPKCIELLATTYRWTWRIIALIYIVIYICYLSWESELDVFYHNHFSSSGSLVIFNAAHIYLSSFFHSFCYFKIPHTPSYTYLIPHTTFFWFGILVMYYLPINNVMQIVYIVK